MAYSCMSIPQTFSSKLCSGIKSFSSCSDYTKNSLVFPTIRYGPINSTFHLNQSQSNPRSLKHYIKARKLDSDCEENKDEEKSDWEESEGEEKSDWEKSEGEEKSDWEEKKEEEEYRAEETVLKLYSNIKDRNIDGISEVIGDECQCFCNFLSKYQLLQGKKQVMAFFFWLIKKLGKDIKIVVKPSSKDGMTVGVQWQLEWEKPHIQLGKGFSFHICHIYQGRLLIKNVEMFMEPIFHIEPLRLRTIAFAVSLAEKIVTFMKPEENIRRQAMTVLLLALLLLATATFYFTRLRL